jgi:hypothetical protein
MARQTFLDKCRPTPVLTDRRSLNRARPPPIYLQREEVVTPGVYPKVVKKRTSSTGKKNDNLPAMTSTQVQDAKKNHHHKSSITQYRRRVVSEDYIKNQQQPSKSINPLQNRLIRSQRNSSGLKKAASECGGAGGSLLTTRITTQGGRHTDVRNRELVSTGYAQLRSRKMASSNESDDGTNVSKPVRKGSLTQPPSSSSSLSSSSSSSSSSSLDPGVRLPTIMASPAAPARKGPLLSPPSASKPALAPLM